MVMDAEVGASPQERGERRRGSAIAGIVVAAALLVAVAFVWSVDRRQAEAVQREVAALRAAGKPTTSAEAAPPPVPASQNAAPLYEAAVAALVGSSGGGSSRFGTPAEQAAYVAANRRSLALLASAVARPRCRFARNYQTAYLAVDSRHFDMKRLADLTMSAAQDAAARGQNTKAAEYLLQGLVIPRHLSQDGSVMAQLVACSLDECLIALAEKALNLGDIPPSLAARLSGELQAVDYVRASCIAFDTSRAWGLDTYSLARRNPTARSALPIPTVSVSPTPLSWRARMAGYRAVEVVCRESPLLWADELQYLRAMAVCERLLPLPWRISSSRWSSVPLNPALPVAVSGVRGARYWGDIVRKRDMVIARRGLMQAALALEQYTARRGSYPTSLGKLGATEPDVPYDVFSSKEYAYRATGGRYLLYSVGPNLRDDSGRHDRDNGDIVWRPGGR